LLANCGTASTIAIVRLAQDDAANEADFFLASREGLRREIRAAKDVTDGVVGVNIMFALTNYRDLVEMAVEEKADFIASGAGLPLKLPELVGDSKIKLIPIVSSPRAAELIVRTWKKRYGRTPDAIVVEGPMAGGHLGFAHDELEATGDPGHRLEEMIQGVLEVANTQTGANGRPIPVVAAGGVFDGVDIARFLRMGAAGVQMATRFVATVECSVAEEFKQAYVAATPDDLVLIPSPVGMPGRAIRTVFIDRVTAGTRIPFRCSYVCLKTCKPNEAPYCIAKAMLNAAAGDLDNAVVFAGSNVARVTRIMPVRELIEELVSQTQAELTVSAG
jgi:nitronate monooxygenase